MNKKVFVVSEQELDQVIDFIVDLMKHIHIFAFVGSLGAGKTSLIRKLLHTCKVPGKITSPTFGYLHIYENLLGQNFYHFDLYRLTTSEQFEAAGFDEYLFMPESWVFIEWPQLIMSKIEKNSSLVTIEYADESNKRKITITW